MGLGDASIPEDSPLWAKHSTQSETASPQPLPTEVPAQAPVGEANSPMVRDGGAFPAADLAPLASDVQSDV